MLQVSDLEPTRRTCMQSSQDAEDAGHARDSVFRRANDVSSVTTTELQKVFASVQRYVVMARHNCALILNMIGLLE